MLFDFFSILVSFSSRDRLLHLIVALPKLSIQLFGYQMINKLHLVGLLKYGVMPVVTGKILQPYLLVKQFETWFSNIDT